MKVCIIGFGDLVFETFTSWEDAFEWELSEYEECEYKAFCYLINIGFEVEEAVWRASEYARQEHIEGDYWYTEREVIE